MPAWAVKFGHLALYVLMLFVPTVAVMRAFGGERPFAVFGVQLSAGHPAGQGIEALTAPASLHGEMAWLLGVLILGHILMVVFHSAVLKDRTRLTDKTDEARPDLLLPGERNGLMMVFRTFERVSYALILQITDGVKSGDRFVNP